MTKAENYPLLHQNGIIIRIMRDTDRLAREGRPLSQQADLAQMAQVRNPFYEQFADLSIANNNTPEETVNAILEALR